MKLRFWILVSIVAISGFSQGLLLPLIAIIFETDGINSSLNGLHATGLYIGVLLASPFMEKPLQKFGFKPLIVIGGLLVIISLALFPIWHSILFWYVLRLVIGIGDNMLHFATQTWITSTSPADRRGRNISLYGLSFGIGFALGPMITPLVEINVALPFIVSAIISLAGWLTVFLLKNEMPSFETEGVSHRSSMGRFKKALQLGWIAFLPPLGYGFLEASLNGNFPVYALRIGLTVEHVAYILPSFVVGSILFQFPLGIISDRIGRRNTLILVLAAGSLSFLLAFFSMDSIVLLLLSFFVAGMFVGSTFSMGISYMADLLPTSLHPAGNLLCGIAFSVGSISGPFIGGLAIQFYRDSFFLIICIVLFLIFTAVVLYRPYVLKETSV
ncbi:MFS transporter [Bacillus sp. HMF5848]|uniref:MFS transporter n=1 Tax=Bacillus sp. HMF5848 TaxID=2495421 RepID=UPI000F79ABF0|nr:MFS transporter [Bacillus sp. HMF5848]RSK26068.1 MFS transporter [Bacillus sp. HMF5848]